MYESYNFINRKLKHSFRENNEDMATQKILETYKVSKNDFKIRCLKSKKKLKHSLKKYFITRLTFILIKTTFEFYFQYYNT